ncbi:Aste57867_1002 [Aphanomyces stellatus]|uniref:Aste57867_1002 protein n=1 Tax=Aphanomyces stellatus TaxID=120398 RepID=A0A485K967_9STRA|nr:hypothetical protein As57867_001001 [Aphanomyces stellatus]VFT78224.1 Aste57867_1002 [Aphanomyces stellatus]
MDKTAVLRSLIDTKLRDEGIYAQLRQLIEAHVPLPTMDEVHPAPDGGDPAHAVDDVLHNVLESDVVQQLIASMQILPLHGSGTMTHDVATSDDRMTLTVRVLGGRAFVDHLMTSTPPTSNSTTRTVLRVHLAFQGHRFHSRAVACGVDPPFDEVFAAPLHVPSTSMSFQVMAKWEALCGIQEPLHWTVTKHTQVVTTAGSDTWRDLSVELVAAQTVDWRQWLASPHPTVHFPVTLEGPLKVPVGILDIRVDVTPPLRKSTAIVHEAKQWLQKEQLRLHGCQSHVYQYCKQWWAEYTSMDGQEPPIAATTQPHWVRLFAPDECHKYRLVCAYVTPLRDPWLTTPSEAARFVSLIPFVRAATVGSGRDACWHSLPAFLALGHGDCEEHAILLASLLLGFGLPVFVCLGTRRPPAGHGGGRAVRHAWVATVFKTNVDLWEPVTGDRIVASSPECPYDRLDCLFNNTSFYANCQRGVTVPHLDWTVENSRLWKLLDTALVAQVPSQPPIALRPPLAPTTIDLERTFREWVESTRQTALGMATHWHDALGHTMGIALTSYELERVYGVANVDNVYFQSSIQHAVPLGHTFKGFPVSGTDVASVQRQLVADVVGREIIHFPSARAQFGLAVKGVPYPEGLTVVWVMVAVVFQA